MFTTSTPSTDASIPSAQTTADGIPRFRVPEAPNEPDWPLAVEAEACGGVSAEVRAFLDAQVESGDVVVDLDPGFGFVALAAATSPAGLPTVFVAGLAQERMQSLQDAAADAGGWLDELDLALETDLAALVDTRLDTNGRVIVHAGAAQVPAVCASFESMIGAGRVLAICIGDAGITDQWDATHEALDAAGLAALTLGERDGDIVLLPLVGAPLGAVFALPSALAGPASGEQPADAIADATAHVTAGPDANAEPLLDATMEVFPGVGNAHARWIATRDGFSFIAPHSRTGYGVTGAHLLRAMQERGVPVAFFPIGPVDRTLTTNAALDGGVRLQGAYRDDVPSVRLSQQFDLAMHVGRGPRIGFTIFELDVFTDRELHHLQHQDALVVCTEWARQTCLDNGITRPIHVVPLGVDRTVFHENVPADRRDQDTVFLQVGKLEPRKGQRELLRAFEDAFTPRDNVRLVLACPNPFMPRADFDAALRPFKQSRMASRISLVVTELPTQHDVAKLMANADCGVFASRAEGWNLEALEMLSMGKAVIATACTAHGAFLNERNARLVRTDRMEVAHGAAKGGRWAAWDDAQHEQLVAHLRAVHAHRSAHGPIRNAAGVATAQQHTWDASADALLRALAAVA